MLDNDPLIKGKFKDWLPIHDPMYIGISAGQFFENFYADNATFGVDDFCKANKWWDIKKSAWSGSLPQTMTLSYRRKVDCGPFCEETGVWKTFSLLTWKPDKFVMELDAITDDPPYSTYFSSKEAWFVYSIGNRSIFWRKMFVKFTKWTMMEGTIKNGAYPGIITDGKEWYK